MIGIGHKSRNRMCWTAPSQGTRHAFLKGQASNLPRRRFRTSANFADGSNVCLAIQIECDLFQPISDAAPVRLEDGLLAIPKAPEAQLMQGFGQGVQRGRFACAEPAVRQVQDGPVALERFDIHAERLLPAEPEQQRRATMRKIEFQRGIVKIRLAVLSALDAQVCSIAPRISGKQGQ
ncbi:MAG: hypothetical protein ABI304_04935 [Rudaea sp.]